MAVRRNIMVDSTQGLHEAGHFGPRLTKSLLACVILPVSTDLGSERLSSCAFCPVSDMTPVGMIFCSEEVKSSQNFLRGSAPRPAARRGGFAGLCPAPRQGCRPGPAI